MTTREELELVKKELLKWTDVQLNLKNRVDELETKIEEEESKEQEQEWPQDGDVYYFVDDAADVYYCAYDDDSYCDCGRKSVGNMFKTKEEAEFELERLKVMTELKKFARPFRPGTRNHYLAYDHEKHRLYSVFSWNTDHGEICYDSAEKAKEVSEAVGEDRIIKYYFGVVE